MSRVLTLSLALCCAAAPAAIAQKRVAVASPSAPTADACALRADGAWVRLPPMEMPMLAGFGRISNPCGDAVAVVGARSDAFADVSLHETRIVDGVSRMRAVPRLPVPARGSVELKPGGLHLMLMRPHAPLKAGESVDVVLELEGGATRVVRFEVRSPTSR